ncbi:DNA-binding response regulator [Tersicoccus phoenicis]|uniref:DNA-binding response regulator n=1 Tax=Tersicoccus phoenicis TaxID=554083 RepID=A0A1R1L6K7_9MICC|nr:DNA-binding response regulator [Tersicoccus phoenicis]
MRVLIADDHPVIRAGLTALFDTEQDIEVAGAVGTTAAAVAAVRELAPDVVLMDLQFDHRFEGAEATRTLRALPDPPAVLVLTNFDTDSDIVSAIEAGAAGYLLKDAPPGEIVAAVRAAAVGQTALAPAVASRLLTRMRERPTALSSRELQVLDLVARGHSNTEVAGELYVSETTVKSHLAHIYPKLGVSSRTAAVAAARRAGYLRRG